MCHNKQYVVSIISKVTISRYGKFILRDHTGQENGHTSTLNTCMLP